MIEKLTEILSEYTGNGDIVITKDMAFAGDLGLNSLDLVQLTCIVEDEFDIEIPDRSIKDLKTVGDLIEFIEQQ